MAATRNCNKCNFAVPVTERLWTPCPKCGHVEMPESKARREAPTLEAKYLLWKDAVLPHDFLQVVRGFRDKAGTFFAINSRMRPVVKALERDPDDPISFVQCVVHMEALLDELVAMGHPAMPRRIPAPLEGYEDLYEVARTMAE